MDSSESGRTYLDHASATPVRPEARAAYEKASGLVGNPGSIHAEGRRAAAELNDSREIIAAELGCKARDIVFTSGLTEANNLAILGFARSRMHSSMSLAGTHWITTSIEHPSVLECFAALERMGASVSHLDPGAGGLIPIKQLAAALRKETVFISIGWSNSEIGTVQPLREAAAVVRKHEKQHRTTVALHSDAGQAPLYLAPQVHTLGVDLLSLGSGKLYGPRGVGALYVGKRADLAPVVIGGGQERGLRAGTETPALAAGFAAALAADGRERGREAKRLAALRDFLARALTERIPGIVLNGDLASALPHMLNISIPDSNGEYVVLALDRAGIAVSTKSACSEGRASESHVVAALIGDDPRRWRAENTLRISLGLDTSERDVERCARELARIVKEMPVA